MKSIGIKLADGTFYPILNEGNAQSKNLKVTTVKDNQTTVHIDVYSSESGSMDDAEYVDTLEIKNLNPHPNGEPNLSLDIGVDENNDLHAEVRDPETGRSSKTTVNLITRTAAERSEPANFVIDSTNEIDDTLSEVDEVIGTDPNSEEFEFESIDENSSSTTEDTTAKDDTAPVPEDVDFNFDAVEQQNNFLSPTDETPLDMPDDLELPADLGELEPVEDLPEIPDLVEDNNDSIPQENLDSPLDSDVEETFATEEFEGQKPLEEPSEFDVLPDELELDDIDDNLTETDLPEETPEQIPTDSIEVPVDIDIPDEEVPVDIDIPDEEVPVDIDIPDEEIPSDDEVPDETIAAELGDSLSPIDSDAVDVDELNLPEDLAEESSATGISDDLNLDALDIPDIDLNTESLDMPSADSADTPFGLEELDAPSESLDIGSLDMPSDDSTDTPFGLEELDAPSESLDIGSLDMPEFGEPDLTSTDMDLPVFDTSMEDPAIDDLTAPVFEDEDKPDAAFSMDEFDMNDIPDLDLSDAVTSVAKDSFEIPDFDDSFANTSKESADPFGSTSAASLSNSNPLYSQDLYDIETIEGNSRPEGNNGGKTRTPMIICIICAIICIIASALVLFVIPSKVNIKTRLEHNGQIQTVEQTAKSTEPKAEESAEKSAEKAAQPSSGSAVTEIIVTQSKGDPVTIDTNTKPQDNAVPAEAAVPASTAESQPATTEPVQAEPEVSVKEPETPQPVTEEKNNFSAKEDQIVVVATPEIVVPEPPAPPPVKPEDIRYKVKWGDTLWDISKAYYKNPWRYRALAKYNNIKDPDRIIAGSIIRIPAE